LRHAGCERLFHEARPQDSKSQPALTTLINEAAPGDVVVIASLFQLSRCTGDLLAIVTRLRERDLGLRSLAETWVDTTSADGAVVWNVLLGLQAFEQTAMGRRSSDARSDAKARGVRFGRPPSLAPDQVALGRELVEQGTSVRRAAAQIGCHYASLYRALAAKEESALAETPSVA
jgi:DNA invertase Pin-like site-specific DNA recombinase